MNGWVRFHLTLSLVLFALFAFAGCDNGDIEKASGDYEVTVIDPNGNSAVGSASVSNSGDTFSIVIHSSAGDFAIIGSLIGNELEVTFTDSSGSSATAFFEFSIDRSTFTGSISTTTGVFVVRGIRL